MMMPDTESLSDKRASAFDEMRARRAVLTRRDEVLVMLTAMDATDLRTFVADFNARQHRQYRRLDLTTTVLA